MTNLWKKWGKRLQRVENRLKMPRIRFEIVLVNPDGTEFESFVLGKNGEKTVLYRDRNDSGNPDDYRRQLD